jgi:signal transduction histidine kinase
MINKIYGVTFIVGAVLILISSVLVMEHVAYSKYAFAAGVAMYIVSRMRSTYQGDDFRLKRLNRLYFLSSIFMLIASYMQFKGLNSWVAVLLMSALTELYVAVRFSWYERENKAKENEPESE